MFQFSQPQKPLDAHDFSKSSFNFLEESIDIQDGHQGKAPEEELHDFEVDHDARNPARRNPLSTKTIWRVLLYIILFGGLGDCAGDLNPRGNVTVVWDIMSVTGNGYDAYVRIKNLELEKHMEKPGWQLSWTWHQREVIWYIGGAEAAEQGNCLGFVGELPHSCERSPKIIDLLPTAPYNKRVKNCCKDGVLSSLTQDKNESISEFHMFVGMGYASPDNISAPSKFHIGVDGYSCDSPIRVPSSRYLSSDGRRYTQALLSWHVVCTYNQPRISSCCVSLSAFYSKSIAGCAKCTSHMCPVRIHWHVKESYRGYWLAKLTLTNYNLQRNYSDWNVFVEHPNLRALVNISDFKYSTLGEHGKNDSGLFWGKRGLNDLLVTYQQTQILMRKEKGIFTFANGWVFPKQVHFNGDSCSFPKISHYPKLPKKPGLLPVISSWIVIFVMAVLISITVLHNRQYILGDYRRQH